MTVMRLTVHFKILLYFSVSKKYYLYSLWQLISLILLTVYFFFPKFFNCWFQC